MSAGALLANLEAPKPTIENTLRFSFTDNVSFCLFTITYFIQEIFKKDLLQFSKSRRLVITVVEITVLY